MEQYAGLMTCGIEAVLYKKQRYICFITSNKALELRILNINEDRTAEICSSVECQQLFDIYEGYYAKKGFNQPWVAYWIVRNNTIVGTCSFTEKPNNGIVEIAYWTFKAYEGQGVASFACKALVDIAQKTDPTVTITAKTAPEHNASTKTLQRNSFTQTEVVQDNDIGDAWLWVLK